MDNLIDAVLEALSRIQSFKKDLISINELYNKYPVVHVSADKFFKHFNNYKAIDRDDYKYPIELYEIHSGVKFFCICQLEDFNYGL